MRHRLWLIPLAACCLAAFMASAVAAAPAGPSDAASAPGVDAAKLGAPIYPGSVLDDDYGPNKYKSSEGQTDAHFITKDALAKVVAFYTAHMPANAIKSSTDPKTMVKFEIGQFSDPTYIGVTLMVETDQDGKPAGTQINIVHFVSTP